MSTLTQKHIDWPRLLLLVLACQAVGILGALATFPNLQPWYAELAKPGFTPPSFLFGPVWTTLYLVMAIALYRVQTAEGVNEADRGQAILLFWVQLGLNCAWSFLFFGLHNPLLGVLDIAALWLMILWTANRFARIDCPAGWMMVPYLLWVTYASALNVAIWQLN